MIIRKTTRIDKYIEPIHPTEVIAPESILKKLHFLQITESDLNNVHKLEKLIHEHAEEITRRHYEMLSEIESLQHIINQHSTREQLTATFINYLKSLPNIRLDENYVKSRLYIGIVHSRIQLDPEWFVGSYTRVYEYLIPLIINQFSKANAINILQSLNRVLTLDNQIILESYQRAYDFRHIDMNSQIIEEIIQMDKVKPLLEAVDETISDAENVSAAAEQLTSAVEEVAGHATRTAEQTEDLVKQATRGQEIINESLNAFLSMADEIAKTKEQFDQLFNAIENVTDVVQFINEVANQTNLLALNASIEAARAGEEGRGFAVVADEVRRLAEQTSVAVVQITEMINEVRQSANEVGNQSQELTDQIQTRVDHAKEAISSLDFIMGQVNLIGDAAANIAAIVEEQSAATHDITSRMNDAMEQMRRVQDNAIETGRTIYQSSVSLNNLRQDTIKSVSKLSDVQMIRIVKTDHLLWRWWVYNSLLGYHQINAEEVGDHHRCRLGQWYDRCRSNPQFSSLETFRKLDEPHEKIHKLAYEAAKLLEEGKRDEAQQLLVPIEQASHEVVQLLNQLREEVREFD